MGCHILWSTLEDSHWRPTMPITYSSFPGCAVNCGAWEHTVPSAPGQMTPALLRSILKRRMLVLLFCLTATACFILGVCVSVVILEPERSVLRCSESKQTEPEGPEYKVCLKISHLECVKFSSPVSWVLGIDCFSKPLMASLVIFYGVLKTL